MIAASKITGEIPSGELGESIKKFLRPFEKLEGSIHVLKTVQPLFNDVWTRQKGFDIRRDDRGFTRLDTLVLVEYPYTQRYLVARVKYLLSAEDFEGLSPGYCAMGIKILHWGGDVPFPVVPDKEKV